MHERGCFVHILIIHKCKVKLQIICRKLYEVGSVSVSAEPANNFVNIFASQELPGTYVTTDTPVSWPIFEYNLGEPVPER